MEMQVGQIQPNHEKAARRRGTPGAGRLAVFCRVPATASTRPASHPPFVSPEPRRRTTSPAPGPTKSNTPKIHSKPPDSLHKIYKTIALPPISRPFRSHFSPQIRDSVAQPQPTET